MTSRRRPGRECRGLRRVLQNYTRTITGHGAGGDQTAGEEPDGDVPPGTAGSPPPRTDARWGVKAGWATSCTSPRPATTPRPAAAPRLPREVLPDRGHDKGCARTAPRTGSRTQPATTGATVTDNQMTSAIHEDLARKNLAPGRKPP